MPKIFVSHSSVNNPEAIAISQWLDGHGWSDHFLDITPTRGLSPGERWQEALKAAANRCEAVLFLISQPWLDSKWCLAEFLLAKSLGKNIFGVLIADLDLDTLPLEMTAEYQLCDLVHGDDRNIFDVVHDPLVPQTRIGLSKAGLEKLKTGLKKSGLEATSFPWPPKDDPDRTPYRGLKPLEEKDAAIYFGRDAEIIRGLDELRKLRELGINKILVILGASGAGKSSFLGAGLLPRLKRDNRHFLTMPTIRPGRDALNGDRGLLAALESAFAGYELIKTRGQIRSTLEKPEGLNALLQELLVTAMKQQVGNAPRPTIIIPVDQCEELYSSDIQASQQLRSYLGEVLSAKNPQLENPVTKPQIIVLVTIRTDLYEKLQTDPAFSGIQQQLYNLTPLAPTEYKDIIEGPAEQANKAGNPLEIEPALTERLLRDTKGADALPLLAFTLEHLYVEHGADGDLTLDEYKSVGGIQGAVGLAVRAALSEPDKKPVIPADESQQKALLRSAFIPWLAEIDENTGEHKRRIARWDELPAQTHPMVERLIDLHLLSRDKRKTTVNDREDIVIEVAHEALLRRWPLLSQWLAEDADELRIISAITKSVRAWKNSEYDDEYLDHKGERLLEAEKIQHREDLNQRLGDTGRAYIKRCRFVEREQINNEKRQLETIQLEQIKTRKYQKRVTYILGIVWLLITATGYWVYQQALDTSEQVSKMLVNESQDAVKAHQHMRALKLALLATKKDWRTKATDSATVNLAGIAQDLPLEVLLTGHSAGLRYASFYSDGTRIVTTSWDNTARIWDASTGKQIGPPLKHENAVIHAGYNRTGSRIVTASRDKTARIWDANSGQPLGEPLRHNGSVTHASFNEEGTRIVTASWDKSARIWDASTGKPVGDPMYHEEGISHASFNMDGNRIVTASSDKTARIWNASTGRPVGIPLQHKKAVTYASFNPAGTRIVTISSDNTARIWDVSSSQPVGQPLEHIGTIHHASFNITGTQIVTASKDKTARIWDAKTGQPVGDPIRHEQGISHASFNAEGSRILTSSWDKTARMWDAKTGQPVGDPLRHEQGISHASFNAEGSKIVTASSDKTARIWDANSGQPIRDQMKRESSKMGDSNPAGTRIVTLNDNDTAQIWDVLSNQPVGVPLAHDGVKDARFNSAGTHIVTRSDKTLRTWDASTGQSAGVTINYEDSFKIISFNSAVSRLVTIGNDNTARIWDTSTGEQVGDPLQHEQGINRASFNPPGNRLVTVSIVANIVRIWDARTGKQVGDTLQHDAYVKEVSFNMAGTRMVTTSMDNTARIWDTSNAQLVGIPLQHKEGIKNANFNPAGTRILTISYDNTARIWDASTGQPTGIPLQHESTIHHAGFSPDGTMIVTASQDETARVWDADTGQPVGSPLKHEKDVQYASFNPAGTRIVTSGDFYIRIWDARTGLSMAKPMPREIPGTHVSFNPTENHIAATGLGFTRIWDVSWLTQYPEREDLLRAVCRKWGADVTTLTESDINEPLIPRNRVGEDTCPSHD